MKTLLAVIIAMCTIATGQNAPSSASLSPAERGIIEARKAIEKKPSLYTGYNQLAVALSRRARETSDVNFYTQAEDALKKSLELAPGNLDAEKIQVWLLLGRHEFAAALAAATPLNQQAPDDVLIYGFLVDANAELGNYDAAEKAAQWMLNLRPGNLPGLTRAAYLRELFGDVEGAYELMEMAYQATPPTENEDGAWILTQMGHLRLSSGKLDDADNLFHQALLKFPGYHYALGNLAKVRILQKRYPEAIDLLQQRYQAGPHAENLYDLAEALDLAGQKDRAQKAYAEFETKSLAESVRADNSTRELVFYYADHAHEPGKALEFARQELARKHDVYTLDAYAWALHVSGQDAEARKQIDTALAVGIQDAKFFRHAGEISRALGDRAAGERYLQESVALNAPGSQQARASLAGLTSTGRRE